VVEQLADLAGAVTTPSLILFPPAWNRPERHSHVHFSHPTDLVVVLSRLTI
jgi:hypothetical protein